MSVDTILFSSVAAVATPAWLASVVLLLCDDFGIADIALSGGETPTMLAWPADPAIWTSRFPLRFPNRDGVHIHRIGFRNHPLGDRSALTIALTIDGTTSEAPASTFFSQGRYGTPVESRGPFTLSFPAETTEITPAWGVPYFAMFDFKLLQDEQQGDH
ncbi:MAG: hypothetical protein RLN70_08065 [Rhodospirillaceae bacterium]